MGRLTQEQWEQARAEYEVRGISLGEIAKAFGVATSSVSRKATVVKITKLGVQITTRRFGGHELFAYREVGRRAIVALSGIQAPKGD